MLSFLILISLATIIGVQLGIIIILKQKGLPSRRSILFSFSIYLLPFLIITAHVELYKKRHLLFQTVEKKKDLDRKEVERITRQLDSKRFLFISIFMAMKDLFTPKDNLLLTMDIAQIYEEKFAKRKHKAVFVQHGVIGIIKKATSNLKGDLVNHASKQYKLKHS